MSTRWREFLRRWHPEGIPWPATVFYNLVSRSEVFRRHYELVADHVAQHCHEGRLLDIGTGPGWLLAALHRRLPRVALVGVDISEAMVVLAQENMAQQGLVGCIEFKVAAAEVLPFPPNTFEAVVSTGSLHHWKGPEAALNEVHRVLREGGIALIYDLVLSLPPAVAAAARRRFGALRASLLWLHSFEEPFYSPREMEALAQATPFQRAEIAFIGALCCLVLRKTLAPAADVPAEIWSRREIA